MTPRPYAIGWGFCPLVLRVSLLADRPHLTFVVFRTEPYSGISLFIVEPQDRRPIAPEAKLSPHSACFIYDFKSLGSDNLCFLRRIVCQDRSARQELVRHCPPKESRNQSQCNRSHLLYSTHPVALLYGIYRTGRARGKDYSLLSHHRVLKQ